MLLALEVSVRRLMLSLLLIVFIVFGNADSVSASCVPLEPRKALNDADAAFVGRLVEAPNLSGEIPFPNEDVWVFEVEEWVKGDLGPRVEVVAPVATSVDFGFGVGERVGVLIVMRGDVPTSSGCSTTSPEILLAAARPLPVPDGEGPIAVLVGGGFGDVRLMAFDGEGRTLAYGAGEGTVRQISVCPGSRFSVEVAGDFFGPPVVAVRDLSTLELVREIPASELAPSLDEVFGATVRCRDEAGSDVLVLITGGEPERAVIVNLDASLGVSLEGVWSDWQANLGMTHAVLLPYIDASPTEVVSIELVTGEEAVLFQRGAGTGNEMLGDIQSVALSPDETRVAILDRIYRDDVVVQELIVVGIDGDNRVSIEIPAIDNPGSKALWVNNETLVVATEAYEDMTLPVWLYDSTSLEQVGEWNGWTATPVEVSAGELYGLEGMELGGAILVSAAVATGPQLEIRAIPSEGIISVVAVDDSVEVDSSGKQPEATTPESTPPVTLGSSSTTGSSDPSAAPGVSQSDDNTTIYLILGGLGLVAVALIVIRLIRRPSRK